MAITISGSSGITTPAEGIATTTLGNGAIVQVQNTTTSTTGTLNLSTANQYYDIPNLNVSITPKTNTNKILLTFHAFGESETNEHLTSFQVKRAISGGATTSITAPAASNRIQALTMLPETYYGGDHSSTPSAGQISNYLDAPSTTSAVTYTVQVRCYTADQDWFYNRTDADSDDTGIERGVSWITVMEVVA
tara:strand:+ start:310 stop:885 length:576 start_codon:yes stop_codon:yes gene_type:complete